MKLIDQWHYNWLEDYLKRNPDDFVVGRSRRLTAGRAG